MGNKRRKGNKSGKINKRSRDATSAKGKSAARAAKAGGSRDPKWLRHVDWMLRAESVAAVMKNGSVLLDGAKDIFGPFLEILANSVLRLQASAGLEAKPPVPADALGDVEGTIARLSRLDDGRQAMREAGDWFLRNHERLESLAATERQAWLALLDEHVRARTRDAAGALGVAEIQALTDAFILDLSLGRKAQEPASRTRRQPV